MYNSQIVKDRINSTIKTRNTSATKVLELCGFSPNVINQMSNKNGLSSFNLAKIADCLEVSVDYLLGRTDNPQTVGGHSIKIKEIHGDNSANVNIGETIDKETLELAQMIKELSIVERAEIVLKINEMLNKK